MFFVDADGDIAGQATARDTSPLATTMWAPWLSWKCRPTRRVAIVLMKLWVEEGRELIVVIGDAELHGVFVEDAGNRVLRDQRRHFILG